MLSATNYQVQGGVGGVPDQSCREGKFDGSKHKVLGLEIISQSKNSIFIFSMELFSGRKRWNKQRNIETHAGKKIFSSVFSAFSSILSWRPFDILNSIQLCAATIIYSFNDFFYRGLFLTVKKWESDTSCPHLVEGGKKEVNETRATPCPPLHQHLSQAGRESFFQAEQLHSDSMKYGD